MIILFNFNACVVLFNFLAAPYTYDLLSHTSLRIIIGPGNWNDYQSNYTFEIMINISVSMRGSTVSRIHPCLLNGMNILDCIPIRQHASKNIGRITRNCHDQDLISTETCMILSALFCSNFALGYNINSSFYKLNNENLNYFWQSYICLLHIQNSVTIRQRNQKCEIVFHS